MSLHQKRAVVCLVWTVTVTLGSCTRLPAGSGDSGSQDAWDNGSSQNGTEGTTSDPEPGGFIVGTAAFDIPALTILEKGESFTDATFHTNLVRITDRGEDGYSDPGIENEYSKIDPENSDGTRLILRGNHGAYHLYDALTYASPLKVV